MTVRRQQGELIAQTKGSIKILDDRNYVVNSQSGNGSYNIQLTESGFVCSCADHVYRVSNVNTFILWSLAFVVYTRIAAFPE